MPIADSPQAITPENEGSQEAGPEAPVVVFVPGLGLDARSWEATRRKLTGRSVVVLLPSMGQPAPRGAELRVERQAGRLLEALPASRPVILVGHSASCPVVVEVAARSTTVAGLVLVGPVTDPAAQSWPRLLRQWARAVGHERPWEGTILAPQYRRTGPASMLRGMDAVRHFRTDVALGRLSLPVEIVRGDKDRIASQKWSSTLQRASHGRLTVVPGAAHMVPLTHSAAVVAAVDRMRLVAGREGAPAAE